MNKYDADRQIKNIHSAFAPLNNSVTPPLEISPFMIERQIEKLPKAKRKFIAAHAARILAAALALVIVLGTAAVGLKYYSSRINDELYLSSADKNEQTNEKNVIKRLNKLYENSKDGGLFWWSSVINKSVGTDMAPEMNEGARSGEGHSETNVQEKGVNEGDNVITDGEYIYIMRTDPDNCIETVNAKTMKKLSQIKVNSGDNNLVEMYLSDNLLTVLDSRNNEYGCMDRGNNGKAYTNIRIYDVSDKSAPKLRSKYAVTGSLISSRMVDGVLYITANEYISVDKKVNGRNVKSYLPKVEENGKYSYCGMNDICFIGGDDSTRFVNFCALNIKDKSAKMNIKSVMCDGVNDVYYTKNSAYLWDTRFIEHGEDYSYATDFIKLGLSGEKITTDCKFSANGRVDDRLYMSERGGYFRVVLTEDSSINSKVNKHTGVYVFDKNGKKVGSITGLGKNEDVYSVRFEGDICYFVTYETKDPLFAVDLSDPKNPRLISKLESPGYSTYLYRVNGYLVGVGNTDDLDPKISLFDEDGKTELDTVRLADALKSVTIVKVKGSEYMLYNVYSQAVYDFHAFCANEKNGDILIPFTADGEYSEGVLSKSGLAVYTVNGGRLKIKKVLVGNFESDYVSFSRALYIGDFYYYVDDSCVVRYDSTDDFAAVKLKF